MTPQDVREIVDRITYKPGWKVLCGTDKGRMYIQVEVDATTEASLDSQLRDGTRTPWKGAKRYLSPHMCKQEVVGIIFDAIKAAEMHEVHEWFRYRGAAIFNPHLDPDALAELARKKSSFVVRENAMSMEEPALCPHTGCDETDPLKFCTMTAEVDECMTKRTAYQRPQGNPKFFSGCPDCGFRHPPDGTCLA